MLSFFDYYRYNLVVFSVCKSIPHIIMMSLYNDSDAVVLIPYLSLYILYYFESRRQDLDRIPTIDEKIQLSYDIFKVR